jgi:hypothetical protein
MTSAHRGVLGTMGNGIMLTRPLITLLPHSTRVRDSMTMSQSLLRSIIAPHALLRRWSGLMRGAVSVALVYLHFDRMDQAGGAEEGWGRYPPSLRRASRVGLVHLHEHSLCNPRLQVWHQHGTIILGAARFLWPAQVLCLP